MVVVSHLFLFLRKNFRGRFDSCESNLPLFGTIYFPTAPFLTLYGQTVKECYRHKIKPFFSQKISAISLPGNSSKR